MKLNDLVYFVSDFLTWLEYGQMMPNTFHFESIFKKIGNLKSPTQDQIATIIEDAFEKIDFISSEQKILKRIGKHIVEYIDMLLKDKTLTNKNDKSVKNWEYKGYKYFGNSPQTIEVTEQLNSDYFSMYLAKKIDYDHFAELVVLSFARNFRVYRQMTVKRMELGIKLLYNAIEMQASVNSRELFTPHEVAAMTDRLKSKAL